jgi:hypothetical protein
VVRAEDALRRKTLHSATRCDALFSGDVASSSRATSGWLSAHATPVAARASRPRPSGRSQYPSSALPASRSSTVTRPKHSPSTTQIRTRCRFRRGTPPGSVRSTRSVCLQQPESPTDLRVARRPFDRVEVALLDRPQLDDAVAQRQALEESAEPKRRSRRRTRLRRRNDDTVPTDLPGRTTGSCHTHMCSPSALASATKCFSSSRRVSAMPSTASALTGHSSTGTRTRRSGRSLHGRRSRSGHARRGRPAKRRLVDA